MATYEVEHALPPPTSSESQTRPRRPSLSTFFSALSAIDTTATSNTHSVPTPGDVSTAYRLLASAFDVMRDNTSAGGSGSGHGNRTSNHDELMDLLISSLLNDADTPPREVRGVGEQFLTDLERVPKGKLEPDQMCPICNHAFLEDRYPLVVRLPCHRTHLFDLECVAPWLRLNSTCPLDRSDLLQGKKEEARKVREAVEKDDEEEWDDMYA